MRYPYSGVRIDCCADCHQTKKIAGRNRCHSCYSKLWRKQNPGYFKNRLHQTKQTLVTLSDRNKKDADYLYVEAVLKRLGAIINYGYIKGYGLGEE